MTNAAMPSGGVFTRYLRSLDPRGEPPDEAGFDVVWQALRGVLHRELRKRGLWQLPPGYLGIYGWQHWTDSAAVGGRASDALDELVADCYSFIFVLRLASLRAQLKIKPNVDGLVYLNVGHFVHELQQRHDPLGARVFTILRTVVRGCVDEGLLFVVDGEERVGNDTVLAFACAASVPGPASEAELRTLVEPWSDELLPELVTTRGKGQRKLHTRVRAKVLQLAREGVDAFAFQHLVGPLKGEARRRWAAIFERADGGEKAAETTDGERAVMVALVAPDSTFETREDFRRLIDCVARKLTSVDDQRTCDELKAIWELLVSWAAEAGDLPEPSHPSSPLDPETAPSRREIARLLGIPRDRLPKLYDKLGSIVRGCQAAAHPPGERATAGASKPLPAGAEMSDDDTRARLRRATGEAMARSIAAAGQAQDSEAPQPGDVYVIRASAAWPVEWVVLDADPADAGRVLAVPADTQPLAGRADVSIPEDSPAGPLTLRCGLAVSLPRGIFDPQLRSRRLSPGDLERAREHRCRIEDGAFEGSVAQQETELDAAYRDWMREVPEAARAAVEASAAKIPEPLPFPARQPPERRSRRWIEALAAVLAAVSVGLALLVLDQHREQAEPHLATAVEQIRFLDPPRTLETWRLTRGPLILDLVGLEHHGCDTLRVEFLDADERLLWVCDGVEIPPEDQLRLVLPRRFLEREPARLRLFGLCDEEPQLLEQRRLRILRK